MTCWGTWQGFPLLPEPLHPWICRSMAPSDVFSALLFTVRVSSCPSAFNQDPTHLDRPPFLHPTQKPPFSWNRTLNSASPQPAPAVAPYTALTQSLLFINRAIYFLPSTLPLHTAHGAIQLFAKQTFQTQSVKTKRALVVVQCCEEKCFFPDTGTAPALFMGSIGILLLLSQGTGSRLGTQVHFQEENLMAWMWQGTVHPYQPTFRPGFITLDNSWFCRRHCTQLWGVPALGSETALEEGRQSSQAGMKWVLHKAQNSAHLQAFTQQQLSPCRKGFPPCKTPQ